MVQVTKSTADALKQGASLVKTSSGNFVRTSSGGVVRTRTKAEIEADSRKFSSSSGKDNKGRSTRSNRREPPEVVDIRDVGSKNQDFNGDTIVIVENVFSKDTDDSRTTLAEYLNRQGIEVTESSVRNLALRGPVTFAQNFAEQFSSGALRLEDPTLAGLGFGGGSAGGRGQASGMSSLSSIHGLPIPDNLQEALRIGYDSKSQGVTAHLQNAVFNSINAGLQTLAADGGTASDAFASAQAEIEKRFQNIPNYLEGGAALNNLIGALFNMAGVGSNFNTAFNNTMVQQFSGVSPRSFTFQWRLYAEDAAQTSKIFRTIQIFKMISHPKIVDEFLKIIQFPMKIKKFDIRSPNGLVIFPIFESVITDVVIDYSGSGAPTFFKSGAPTSINLSLTLTEITSATRDDYAANPPGF